MPLGGGRGDDSSPALGSSSSDNSGPLLDPLDWLGVLEWELSPAELLPRSGEEEEEASCSSYARTKLQKLKKSSNVLFLLAISSEGSVAFVLGGILARRGREGFWSSETSSIADQQQRTHTGDGKFENGKSHLLLLY